MRVIPSVRNSVKDNVAEWFPGYTIYGESDMRNESLVLSQPFMFVLDYGVIYEHRHLPVILVQTETSKRAFELGTLASYQANLALHVIGRSRGERDSLASQIIEDVDSLKLYRYVSSGSKVQVAERRLEPDRLGDIWTVAGRSQELAPEEARAGTLLNWTQLATRFWVLGGES